jgi:rubrerythrin
MFTDQDVTLSALNTAIQMEIDGKKYYTQIAEASKNELGKKMLTQLAVEEDIHRKVFEGIYRRVSVKKGWPTTKIDPKGIIRLKTIFSEATRSAKKDMQVVSTEITAVATAMEMENKTYDFYKERSGKATYPGEKELYEEIAAQEKEHHRILLDYYEFLKDPAHWYVEKERQSVDGG